METTAVRGQLLQLQNLLINMSVGCLASGWAFLPELTIGLSYLSTDNMSSLVPRDSKDIEV